MSAEQTGAAAAAPDPRAVLFLGVLGAVLLYTKVEEASGDPPECS